MARKVFTDLDFNSVSKVINLATPSAAGDATSKSYVDSLVEGLAWKDSCRVATQANLNLSSPGATIDGITMASLDRVLVRSQTTTSENGIYVWNGAAVAMTRALDANTFAELEQAVYDRGRHQRCHHVSPRSGQRHHWQQHRQLDDVRHISTSRQ